ncbi:chymotrypsinogen B-like [Temnothorax curvispinosus]|uniref:Chymotrypsinogen B-like n=1 Tax=Temnothorax curvispinosus TaxID=300111 RepID=A0A6J1QKP5_9HYME|nr:chymotrypsinogen B-like [Temnothorax curvispinosus]
MDEDSDRIVGGHNAKHGDFPYVAMIHQLVGNETIRSFGACGVTVLFRRWVLTASHYCVIDCPQKFSDAQVIDWRKDNTDGKDAIKLKYATVPIIENNVCKQSWLISDKHICTTAGLVQDACEDFSSGGSLIVRRNGRALQIGIVSYGEQACPNEKPYVFTKVSSYSTD